MDLLAPTIDQSRIKYRAKLHWISFAFNVVMIVLMSLLSFLFLYSYLMVVPLFLLFKFLYSYFLLKSTEIYITSSVLTISYGIFSKKVVDISLRKYEGMFLHQSFLGKMLNYGKLTVSTGEISQKYKIENPMELRNNILKFKSE